MNEDILIDYLLLGFYGLVIVGFLLEGLFSKLRKGVVKEIKAQVNEYEETSFLYEISSEEGHFFIVKLNHPYYFIEGQNIGFKIGLIGRMVWARHKLFKRKYLLFFVAGVFFMLSFFALSLSELKVVNVLIANFFVGFFCFIMYLRFKSKLKESELRKKALLIIGTVVSQRKFKVDTEITSEVRYSLDDKEIIAYDDDRERKVPEKVRIWCDKDFPEFMKIDDWPYTLPQD
ncbi:MAG: hypothetical protein DWQ02_04020 [Bacteroidetes bacterium]|nr:MAG: hypothetical protein DWQ02_04020 [Bacteroidota bacterium]